MTNHLVEVILWSEQRGAWMTLAIERFGKYLETWPKTLSEWDEIKLIEEIVSDIQKKLHHEPSPSIDAERLVGMKSRVKDIDSLLSFGSTGVLIVGIWGMGGIGKSTTAEAVYHRNCSKFEGHCFFQNVREESQKHGIDHVRQEILGEVLEKKDMTIRTKVLPPAIKRMLQRKKVLIVLDDVNDPQVLKYLLGEDGLFGQGSRIMVTSRDRQVLINECDEDKIYEVEILEEDDALRLFSLHAFKQNNPIEGYIGLSKTVVSCVKGVPLVLEVLGASLCRKTSVEYWESKVAQLRKNGCEDIKKCLEMCYHELDQTEKKIFLDIACFFGRCKRDHLQQTLDLEERSGIDRLIDMCLIKIVQNKIWMHDVLVKLGKKIVHQENVDPRERSRLWQADDIYRVLTTQRTGSKMESISLNLLAITEEMILSPTAFEGMYNLRLLKIYYPPFLKDPSKEQIMNGKRVGIHLPGGLHFLSSELSLASLPDNIDELKSLVELDLYSCSKLASLPNSICKLKCLTKLSLGRQPKLASLPDNIGELRSLVKLSLSSCSKLASLPDSIGELRSLVELHVFSCSGLANLPDSIGELRSLEELDLNGCFGLASLPNSIGELKSLQWFDLNGCFGLASLPDSIGALKSLQRLYLDGCSGLASLPSSIGGLKSLKSLFLRVASQQDSIDELESLKSLIPSGCLGLTSLPDSIGALKSLENLYFSGCSGLASLPDNIGSLKSLKSLTLHGCSGLASLQDRIGELKSLEKLELNGCLGLASLPDNIGTLKSLKWLKLDGCSGLASLPDRIGELKSLKQLYLNGCSGLASLTDNIGELKSLKQLYLNGCSGLASLPDRIGELKSLELLELNGCSGLASLPDTIDALKCLKKLDFFGCSGLASLPNTIGELESLQQLRLVDFAQLASLPDNIGAMKSLEWLVLSGCSGLASLPDNIGELESLQSLLLSGFSQLASLPDSFGALKSLKSLSLFDCSGLASLPDNIGELESLQSLHLSGFSQLASLPNSMTALKSLKSLSLYGSPGLASLLDNIGALKSLNSLYLSGFSELASLPDNICALKSLESLSIRGCLGLASLPDNIGGLKSLTWLNLSGCSGLKSLPDSIGELKNLMTLFLGGCLKLASLRDNFIDIEFRGLDKQRCYTLRGFQKVEEIASSTYKLGCHEFLNLGNSRVLKTPQSLGSLVSLTKLRLSEIDFERIPASIKHLTKLRELYLDDCKRLQCLPELPSTLQVLIASGCISLKYVAIISMQGDREYDDASQEFSFSGCLQLDQNSRTRIMGDARLRIQRMATSLVYQEYHRQNNRVRLCIPGSEVPECFSYKNRDGSSVKIRQLARWHRGFTLCAVVSFGQSEERRSVNIECECHLIIKDETQIDLSSYYYKEYEIMAWSSTVWKKEQVFIWSVHCKCFFKEASFHFKPLCGATDVVVKCGVHPLLK
ncbi:disease resistance protein RPV1 [Populus trichocarpa]|uniref:disease resistance protein RPV1 n=1 Tax=Populus trichocarpa TaxID=3694 RepID=UPI000D18ADAE|nr:disease resistance protein RPV1 [Populus trichocarpa]|eukprot:XP_024457054.1 protein SUPPRESSOR OF npr1-1, CONSTITUTIVE 1 [Populus trichocarpa]